MKTVTTVILLSVPNLNRKSVSVIAENILGYFSSGLSESRSHLGIMGSLIQQALGTILLRWFIERGIISSNALPPPH